MLEEEKDDAKEENCLYQVIGRSLNGVYLQNLSNNKVFEEINIPQKILDKIGNDYILRYINDTYVIEEELTEEFFERINRYR